MIFKSRLYLITSCTSTVFMDSVYLTGYCSMMSDMGRGLGTLSITFFTTSSTACEYVMGSMPGAVLENRTGGAQVVVHEIFGHALLNQATPLIKHLGQNCTIK